MLYPYECDDCQLLFNVVKSMHDSSRDEPCERCGKIARRIYGNFDFYGANDWNKQEFNHGLGEVVYSNAHKKRILSEFKAKGREMIEIGNEPPEKIHAHFDKRREETRMQRYADAERMK